MESPQTAQSTYEIIRVALVSPSDVEKERELANRIVDDINKHLATPFGMFIELRRWEDFYPGFDPSGPQGQIDSQLNLSDCDIVVGIFWKRLGTLTAFGQTGAEHEIQVAYDSWLVRETPQVMLYFNKERFYPSTSEDARQVQMVIEFRDKYRQSGLLDEYEGPYMFSEHFRNHLTRIIADRVTKRGSTITVVPCFASSSPSYVRAEGVAELVAKISLLFATSIGARPITCNVKVFLNTNITNTVENDSLLADVFLSSSAPEPTTRFRGRMIGLNTVLFENVVIDLAGPVDTKEYAISGLRANALNLGITATGDDTYVSAVIQVESSTRHRLVHVVNASVNIGIVKSGPCFGVLPRPVLTVSRAVGVNAAFAVGEVGARPEISFVARFKEPYLGYFTSVEEESYYVAAETSAKRPTAVHLSIIFSSVPQNVDLYVTIRDMDSYDPSILAARLIQSDVLSGNQGVEQVDYPSVKGLPMARLEVKDGQASATWEWLPKKSEYSLRLPRWLEFGIAVIAAPGRASIGAAMIVGFLSPFSTTSTASSIAPVPRFAIMRTPVPAFDVID